ncbi:MAG: MBL fold metallo-hydrolase [Firmicutes bacterium]|nr:MBL fold metallo-hydrolase [Bacillota bacterium]
MIIKTLSEDTSISNDFDCEHGLSLYIETQDQKVLFDVGAGKVFFENAKRLNVDISDVDILIISHGHNDHGGGLETFFEKNSKAGVYIHHLAFEKYYAMRENEVSEFIGLDKELKQKEQIIPTSDRFFISKGIQVFSNIAYQKPHETANKGLFAEQNGMIIDDTFAHEQNLVIDDNGKKILITGCAHNGIVNILKHFHSLQGCMPDYVVGGFHLKGCIGRDSDVKYLNQISEYLLGTKAKYYTCHCTGTNAYNHMKEIMGGNIDYLSAGSEITI